MWLNIKLSTEIKASLVHFGIGLFVYFFVEYEEVDLSCYIIQVQNMSKGSFNYKDYESHNGPIQYPALHAYI